MPNIRSEVCSSRNWISRYNWWYVQFIQIWVKTESHFYQFWVEWLQFGPQAEKVWRWVLTKLYYGIVQFYIGELASLESEMNICQIQEQSITLKVLYNVALQEHWWLPSKFWSIVMKTTLGYCSTLGDPFIKVSNPMQLPVLGLCNFVWLPWVLMDVSG